ncbi:MAG: helix-turn-helix domain-containing protein [Bacteroidales bacterium]|nr:helix-turn-helix domain-containing protein [Candidatus Physcousia equi]
MSLIWFASFSFKLRMLRQTQYMIYLFFSILFYALIAIYMFPAVDYEMMTILETACIPAGFFSPVYLLSCLHIHRTGKPLSHRKKFSLLVPAIVMSTIILFLYYMVGIDGATCINQAFISSDELCTLPSHLDPSLAHTFCFFTTHLFILYGAVMLALVLRELVLIARNDGYRVGDVSRFFFKGKGTTQSRVFAFLTLVEVLLVLLVMMLGGSTLVQHPLSGCMLMSLVAVVKYCASHVEFYHANKNTDVTLYSLSHIEVGVEQQQNTVHIAPDAIATDTRDTAHAANQSNEPESTQDSPSDSVATSERSSRHRDTLLVERFEHLMEKEQIFKQDDLTAETLCGILGVRRTTLSVALNAHYDKPLRDIINHHRIEEAKRFMLTHPSATQEEVAANCGFRNAQYLNTKFKSVVGQTPATWLAGLNAVE